MSIHTPKFGALIMEAMQINTHATGTGYMLFNDRDEVMAAGEQIIQAVLEDCRAACAAIGVRLNLPDDLGRITAEHVAGEEGQGHHQTSVLDTIQYKEYTIEILDNGAESYLFEWYIPQLMKRDPTSWISCEGAVLAGKSYIDWVVDEEYKQKMIALKNMSQQSMSKIPDLSKMVRTITGYYAGAAIHVYRMECDDPYQFAVEVNSDSNRWLSSFMYTSQGQALRVGKESAAVLGRPGWMAPVVHAVGPFTQIGKYKIAPL